MPAVSEGDRVTDLNKATAGNGAEDNTFSKGKIKDVINGGSNAKICVIATTKDEAAVVEGEAATDIHGEQWRCRSGSTMTVPFAVRERLGFLDHRNDQGAEFHVVVINGKLCHKHSRTRAGSVVEIGGAWFSRVTGHGEKEGKRLPLDSAKAVCDGRWETRKAVVEVVAFFHLEQEREMKEKIQMSNVLDLRWGERYNRVREEVVSDGSNAGWMIMEDGVWVFRVECCVPSIFVSVDSWLEKEGQIASLRRWANDGVP
ncbi:hypothetical protein PIB30_000446 [Stylosanthes scabra]|uniref:Uncharacterized protein n=1 Tax=Stylosanthes scabra TaxID=79078 RepID=A0ABU6V1F1_9FABA|nr:hypothetical protein [Stylosanthes scabra]